LRYGSVKASQEIVIAAQAGIHEHHLKTNAVWIPACAAMTKEKSCRVHGLVPWRNHGFAVLHQKFNKRHT